MTALEQLLFPYVKIALDRQSWPSGVEAQGSMVVPQTDHERVDSIRRAFETNALVDQTSAFPEPGFSRALTKAGAAGIAAPVAPPAPKPPKVTTTTPKPVSVLDGRTDKPEGMNLMQGIQTVSNGADVGSSYSSFGRRLQGSPV